MTRQHLKATNPTCLQANHGAPAVYTLLGLKTAIERALDRRVILDFQGRTLKELPGQPVPTGAVTVPAHANVEIRNGTLELPPGCMFDLGPGSKLHLEGVTITGEGCKAGDLQHGLMMARRSGASLSLHKCYIRRTGPHVSRHYNAVHINGGASGTLVGSFVMAARGSGVVVQGTGSRASCTGCTAHDCREAGFKASGGGDLNAVSCTAADNAGSGFLTTGQDSVMVCAQGCKASRNNEHGYHAEHHSHLNCASHCVAEYNGSCGFTAYHARLEAGPGCRAVRNRQHGFSAQPGGVINALRARSWSNGEEDWNRTGDGQLQAASFLARNAKVRGWRVLKRPNCAQVG
jgi:hypothetical protein